MTKHKRCERCKGRKKVVVDEVDRNNRPFTIEIKCPRCNGTGFEEKKSDKSDVLFDGN